MRVGSHIVGCNEAAVENKGLEAGQILATGLPESGDVSPYDCSAISSSTATSAQHDGMCRDTPLHHVILSEARAKNPLPGVAHSLLICNPASSAITTITHTTSAKHYDGERADTHPHVVILSEARAKNSLLKALHFLILLAITATTISCTQPTHLPADDLSQYVMDESNGLFQEKSVNGMDISLYYKPTGLMVAQEIDQAGIDKLDELQNKYDPYAYFILDLATGDQNALYASGDMGTFSEQLQTLAFRMDQYTNLTTSANDTIPVADFIYPRMYGMSKSATVMFVFSKEKFSGTDWVSFNLSEFGMGTGDQQFRFQTKDIKKTPKLKL